MSYADIAYIGVVYLFMGGAVTGILGFAKIHMGRFPSMSEDILSILFWPLFIVRMIFNK